MHNKGEENDNPPQYSCLENPMDGGAWQATVYGVARVRMTVTKPPLCTTNYHLYTLNVHNVICH